MNAVYSYMCVFFFFLNVCQLPHCRVFRQKKKKMCLSPTRRVGLGCDVGDDVGRSPLRELLAVNDAVASAVHSPALALGPFTGSPSIPEASGRALCGDAYRPEMALGKNRVPSPPPRRLGESEIPYIRDMTGSMF